MPASYHRTILRLVLFIAIVLAMSGCSIEHASMVRDAQDALSVAANRENNAKFDFEAALEVTTITDPAVGYEEAVGLVNHAIRKANRELKADELYGTALTIRAVALWRLGELQKAESDAQRVLKIANQKDPDTIIWPRDRAICDALVPLMKIDVLGDQAVANDFGQEWRDSENDQQKQAAVLSWLEKSKQVATNLVDVTARQPPGHPIRFYLAQAELELVHVVFVALTNLPTTIRSDSHVTLYHTMRDNALARFDAVIKSVPEDADGKTHLDRAKSYYQKLLEQIVQ